MPNIRLGMHMLVPCRRVQNYIIQNNLTFDLEVLCMLRLSTECSIAALGVAYGATKSVVLAIEVVFNIGLAVARKGKHAKQLLKVAQTLTITVVILAILIVPASIHEVCGPRNSVFDFLRGERLFSFAVIVLCVTTTIIIVGLHPWWAIDLSSNVGEPPENKEEKVDWVAGSFNADQQKLFSGYGFSLPFGIKSVLYKGTAYQLCLLAGLFSSVGRVSA